MNTWANNNSEFFASMYALLLLNTSHKLAVINIICMSAHLFFIYLHDVSDNVDPALGREQLEQGLGQGFLVVKVSTDFQF